MSRTSSLDALVNWRRRPISRGRVADCRRTRRDRPVCFSHFESALKPCFLIDEALEIQEAPRS